MKPQITLSSTDILTILNLPITSTRCLSICFVFLIYFSSVLYFSVYKSFTSLVRFISKYFILPDAIVSGIFFLFFLDYSLVVYKIQLTQCIYHINRMKEKIYMIILIVVKKAFDQIQHIFYDELTQKSRNRRELPQYEKGHYE